MQKISQLTATATSDGLFTNGSVATGVSPTILDAGWFNSVQSELVSIIDAAGIKLDPANNAQVLNAIGKLMTGRLIAIRRFTVSGTYIPTAGTKKALVKMVGAGASGGSSIAATSSSYSGAGGGGGGGAFLHFQIDIDAASFSSAVITIGKGGNAVTGAQGLAGGATYFGTDIYASGGGGGAIASRPSDTYYNSNCYLVIPGEGGIYSFPVKTGFTLLSAKKGGIGGWGMLGGAGQLGGSGGDSYYSGNVGLKGNTASGNTPSAIEFGGGGSGCCTFYDSSSPVAAAYNAKASGAGASGFVEIYEFT